MTLATSCRPSFSREIIFRGEEYYNHGAVDVAAVGLNRVAAIVEGSGGDYHVVTDWSESGVVSVSCSCPHFGRGFLCKHLWATVLEVDEMGSANHLQGASVVQPLRLDEIIDPSGDGDLDSWNTDLDEERGGRSEWELRLEEALSAPSKRDADNAHRQVFSQQSDETWIELNLQNCLQAGRVELRPFRREDRADDGEPRAWKLDRSDLCGVQSLQERQLLAILFEIVSGSQLSTFIACGDGKPPVGKFTITEDRLTSVLRELAHFPRFVWRHNDDTPITAA
ncbi:MAG: hypothetical protein GY904_07525, partial [Planctomycetaceae bacterium]|nr:hypothetical protein [Planctomycetaceae bacterium]